MAEIVDIWLDDARLGCGHRRYIVLNRGRLWVHLFYAPWLLKFKMPIKRFDEIAKPAKDAKPRVIRRLIRENVAAARRLGMNDGGESTKLALSLLRESKDNSAHGSAA